MSGQHGQRHVIRPARGRRSAFGVPGGKRVVAPAGRGASNRWCTLGLVFLDLPLVAGERIGGYRHLTSVVPEANDPVRRPLDPADLPPSGGLRAVLGTGAPS